MKILFIANSIGATLRIRVINPAKYLNADYTETINVLTLQARLRRYVLGEQHECVVNIEDYDMVVLQFAWHDDIRYLIGRLVQKGVQVVLDLDDDYFHSNPYYPIDYTGGKVDNLVYALKVADLVTVTTESLAESYAKYAQNVKILPNMIDLEHFSQFKRRDCGVVVGWYSSGIRYREFLDTVGGWIPEDAWLFLAGSNIFRFFPHRQKIVMAGFDDLQTPQILCNIDIGLVPLSTCRFNDGKSELKYLEYGAMGIPAIVSPTQPYRKIIRHGENGFLVNHRRDWNKYINLLLTNDDIRINIGKQARLEAEARDLKANICLWKEAYEG